MENICKILKKDTVLYFRDDKKVKSSTAKYLDKLFDQMLISTDVQETLDLCTSNKINILIIETCLPTRDKVEMLEKINDLNPNLPRIAILDDSLLKYISNLLNAGINHIVLKPLDIKNLLKEISIVYNHTLTHRSNI